MDRTNRTIAIGSTLAHYRISAHLGAGGMGEVFRAEDDKLGRAVALKILPSEVSSDATRLARFRREARTLAALDHPNIVTVFSTDEEDGIHFLTMELIEGKTLDRLIPSGGLSMPRFFKIALPLLDAVAAAHARGIIHRDLKPSNVMVTKGDVVKVLDFGLAKDRQPDSRESNTTAELVTKENQVLGTLAYMAPEQLQGKPVEQEADIFSLGVLLYELASGRSPFAGNSTVELMTSIMRDDPPKLSEARSGLPPRLTSILMRCLAKDPEQRLQSARDLRFALQELEDEIVAEGASGRVETRRPAGRRLWWAAGLGLAAVVTTLSVLRPWLGSAASALGASETQRVTPVVTWPSDESLSRISPDGTLLSFVSNAQGRSGLWIQRTDGGEARSVVSDAGTLLGHAWSPAGDEIAVLAQSEDGTRLLVIPAPLGGRPRLSVSVPGTTTAMSDWQSDRILLERPGTALWSFDLESTDFTEVVFADPDLAIQRQFDLGVDGDTVVFSAVSEGRENLWLRRLSGGAAQQLTDDTSKETDPHCLGPACERVVYLSNRTGQTDVWILDRRSGESRQLRVPAVVEGIDDASTDASLVTLQIVNENANLWAYDPATSQHEPLTGDTLPDYGPSAAPGTQLLAFQRSKPFTEVGGRYLDSQIFVVEGSASQSTNARALDEDGYAPTLSPGGRWVAYLRTSPQQYSAPYFTELWVADVESGKNQRLSESFQMTGFREFPAGTAERNLLWAGPDELLVVEADGSLIPKIVRRRLDANPIVPEQVVALEAAGQIHDLSLSSSGALGFVHDNFEDDIWEFRVLSPGQGTTMTLFSESLEPGSLRLLGHLGDRWIVARSRSAPGDPTDELEILEVRSDRSAHRLGTVPGAYPSTAVLVPTQGAVFVTADEGTTHDVVRLELASGDVAKITANRLPGITYSGIAILEDGRVAYSRQQRNADLWLLRRNAADPNDNP